MHGDYDSWLVSKERDAILDICCNNSCYMHSLLTFLRSMTKHYVLLQYLVTILHGSRFKIMVAVELT